VYRVNELSRLLLLAAVLWGIAFGWFGWRLSRLEALDPARVVGELHLSHWAAILLAALGAIPIGLAIANDGIIAGTLDVTLGMGFIIGAAVVLRREPREALLYAAVGFVAHALFDLAHRPGWLAPELMPRWFIVGGAVYDVYLAAVCYWARRR
jgi:hypothetical protein